MGQTLWLAALLLASACNQTFGLERTKLVDARYFDVGIDAPFACPALGETPEFARTLHQSVLQPVSEYTTSSVTMRATGISYEGIMEGPVDDVMTVAFGNPGCLACEQFTSPRLTPEGDGIYGVVVSMIGYSVELYRRVDQTWMSVQKFPNVSVLGDISSVTRGPTRHLITSGSAGDFREYEITDDGGASELPVGYTETDLGVLSPRSPMLTADGLRLVFIATTSMMTEAMYYTDRDSISGRFSTARELVGVPVVAGAYLTEDCSRIYLSGLGSVFYAQRL